MRIGTRAVVAGLLAMATVGAGASVGSTTNTDPHKVTICHATASKTNPYVAITVDVASIIGVSGHGHDGVNVGDIIPPIFEGDQLVYGGNHWELFGPLILANDCKIPPSNPGGSGGSGGSGDPGGSGGLSA